MEPGGQGKSASRGVQVARLSSAWDFPVGAMMPAPERCTMGKLHPAGGAGQAQA